MYFYYPMNPVCYTLPKTMRKITEKTLFSIGLAERVYVKGRMN